MTEVWHHSPFFDFAPIFSLDGHFTCVCVSLITWNNECIWGCTAVRLVVLRWSAFIQLHIQHSLVTATN